MCIHSNRNYDDAVAHQNEENLSRPPESKVGFFRIKTWAGRFHAAWAALASDDASIASAVADLKRWHDFDAERHELDLAHVNEVRRSIGLSEVSEETLPASIIPPLESVDLGDDGEEDTAEEVGFEIDAYLETQVEALEAAVAA